MTRPGRQRGLRAALAIGLCFALPSGLWAQQAPASGVQAPTTAEGRVYSLIAVISPDELFQDSLYGRALQRRADEARRTLQSENQRLEAALEAEERELTARRARLAPEAFRPLADAFDDKVKGIRAAQEVKARDLLRSIDEDRSRFAQTALPVLQGLMEELGAAVILDRKELVVSMDSVDITDRAIARVDAVLGDPGDVPLEGDAPEPPQPPAPGTDAPAAP